MKSRPTVVKVLTDADLEQNGGQYKLLNSTPIPVHGLASANKVHGGPVLPVYVVNSGKAPPSKGPAYVIQDTVVGITGRPVESSKYAYQVWVVGGSLGVAAATTILHDTFSGTNGDDLSGRSPDTVDPGTTWYEQGANDWNIQSNMANMVDFGGVAGYWTGIDCLVSDFTIEAQIINVNTTGPQGIVFRASDLSHGWKAYIVSGNSFVLYEMNHPTLPSGGTSRASATVSYSIGTNHIIKAVCSGNSITCYLDGANQISYTSSYNATSTDVGLMSRVVGPQDRWDYIKLTVP